MQPKNSTNVSQVLDLATYHSPETKLISGRKKGESARKHWNLDALDKAPGIVEVKVPEKVITLNSSFFLGMFTQSVRALGPDQFKKKYVFTGHAAIESDVNSGILQALKTSPPLPEM
jgi:hypothetical protein